MQSIKPINIDMKQSNVALENYCHEMFNTLMKGNESVSGNFNGVTIVMFYDAK